MTQTKPPETNEMTETDRLNKIRLELEKKRTHRQIASKQSNLLFDAVERMIKDPNPQNWDFTEVLEAEANSIKSHNESMKSIEELDKAVQAKVVRKENPDKTAS